ncbi:MAG: ABC transporter substrate-binding protein [Motiliproteus sp.]
MPRRIGFTLSVLFVILIQGCSDSTPIKIGFISGTSGRVADLGIDSRNGATLATELRNASGGINGRQIELISKDDQQNPDVAIKHIQELINNGVVAIVGPSTSSIATAIEPIASQSKLLLLGVTPTTNELSGKDDYFFRTVSATRHVATKNAQHQLKLGADSFAIALDTRNLAYTQSWSDDFRTAVNQAGGTIKLVLPFASSDDTPFPDIARQLIDSGANGIVMVANSVDTALLAQNIRKLDTKVALAAAEWAGTERLIELGGKSVEGLSVAQYINRYSDNPDYQLFKKRYIDRFKREPGYAGAIAYNAAQVVFTSIAQQHPNESLKQTLLRIRTFNGLQEPIRFDDYGDSLGRSYMTRVVDGKLIVVD